MAWHGTAATAAAEAREHSRFMHAGAVRCANQKAENTHTTLPSMANQASHAHCNPPTPTTYLLLRHAPDRVDQELTFCLLCVGIPAPEATTYPPAPTCMYVIT